MRRNWSRVKRRITLRYRSNYRKRALRRADSGSRPLLLAVAKVSTSFADWLCRRLCCAHGRFHIGKQHVADIPAVGNLKFWTGRIPPTGRHRSPAPSGSRNRPGNAAAGVANRFEPLNIAVQWSDGALDHGMDRIVRGRLPEIAFPERSISINRISVT